MSATTDEPVTRRDKLEAMMDVIRFNPRLAVFIVFLGLCAAALEGIGVSFILPIVEIVQSEDPISEADGLMAYFLAAYAAIGVPFSLGTVILGVIGVLSLRYITSFAVAWLREVLRTHYIRDLQVRAFSNALNAEVQYFDEAGSDDMLNAIITQTFYAGRVIQQTVRLIDKILFSAVYLLIALLIAPILTAFAVVLLGVWTILIRHGLESGYDVGERIADANEQRQEAAQAGTQGIRDVRIFGLAEEIYTDFLHAVDKYTRARITARRNEAAIQNFYNLGVSASVFLLIFLALTYANLSLGALGVFLFAMFQLGPEVSKLNNLYYKVENDLPHLVRTQRFIRQLESRQEVAEGERPVPETIERVEFDRVDFAYADDDRVLRSLNFSVKKGEFVAFVGQSGAGKSTVVSLLARLYEIDAGEIRANGIPIDAFPVKEWRDKITVVRQNPFIFNDSLRYNLTIGNRSATPADIERACEIARIDEFLGGLPDGLDTMLGDDGVRLSGGQKQRVALARAILADAELLILDEATSDLDTHLERQVQQGIENMDHDYAIIAIAHRLSTVENADRIYTMEDGRISEYGKHEELVDEGGRYAKLYSLQSG